MLFGSDREAMNGLSWNDVYKCYRPPVVSNAVAYIHQDAYGTIAVYMCNNGYYFVEGGNTRTILCIGGEWNQRTSDCRGELTIIDSN